MPLYSCKTNVCILQERNDMKKAIELSLKESRHEEESLAASTLTNTIMEHTPGRKPPQTHYQLNDPFNSAPVYNAGPMPQGVAASRPSSAAVDEFSPKRPTYDDISSQVKITHLHYSQFKCDPVQLTLNPPFFIRF